MRSREQQEQDAAKHRAAYRAKLANSGRSADQWHREAENWFDGSIESVDRRLAACDRLLATSRHAMAAEGISAKHLASVGDLGQQREALSYLRRQLLTAGADREFLAGDGGIMDSIWERQHQRPSSGGGHFDPELHGPGGKRCEDCGHLDIEGGGDSPCPECGHSDHLATLDRRFVELEATKFVRAHQVPLDELQIRAAAFAEEATAPLPQKRSAAITAAFVRRVAQLHQSRPRPRVASAPRSSQSLYPDEFLFV